MQEQSDPDLLPFWERVERGQIRLDQYTDDQIIDCDLTMPDGRKAPVPRDYPQVYRDELVRRTQSKARLEIAQGTLTAINTKRDIMNDTRAAPADRLRASDFFVNRFLGTDPINLNVAQKDKIEGLFEDLLAVDDGLLPPELTDNA